MMKKLMILALLGVWLQIPTAQTAGAAECGQGKLCIELDIGIIEPLPFAVPTFIAETAGADQYAQDLAAVVAADLAGTGLFREIDSSAFISQITSFDSPVQYSDWKAINAQALITGSVSTVGDDQIAVKFRLFDVFADDQLGEGLQFVGDGQPAVFDGCEFDCAGAAVLADGGSHSLHQL